MFVLVGTPLLGASQGNATTDQQCIVAVIDKTATNDFILGPEHCYATFAEVLRSRGLTDVPDDATPATVSSATLTTASIIGVHYEFASQQGASFSVSGSDCAGGGLNVPLSWNDRISSTANGCPHIVHYENTNYAGSTASTFGAGGNITGYMDNRTSSIRYFSS